MKISNEQFEELVGEAIDELSDEVKNRMYNVAILVDDVPTDEQFERSKKNKGVDLLGLFEGYAQSSRKYFGVVEPDRITLFRKAILKRCDTIQQVKDQIKTTLRHEIAHHFGLDEKSAQKNKVK